MSALQELRRFLESGAIPEPSEALLRSAETQGLVSLLDDAILRAWPDEPLRRLRQAHRAAAFRGEQQLDLLRRARALLTAAGIRSLPMKGAALIGSCYDAPAERPMDDVDLLALERFPDALALLQDAGFVVVERADHACALRDPVSQSVLELHRGLATCPELFPFDPEDLWAHRHGEPGAERPSGEDLLVQLSVHAAFQHGLRLRLVQFLDFRRVLERLPLDSERLLERARAAGALGCLLASLEAARRIVGAPVPPVLTDALRRQAPRRLLRRLDAFQPEPSAPRSIAAWRLALVGARRLELIARTLAPSAPKHGGVLRRGLELLRRLAV
jgi:hypothetical protein